MSRKNSGGTIAIIITIIMTGGLVYLGISNQKTNASSSTSNSASNLDTLIGKPAPDFSLTDHNGKTYSLADLKGKKVVLFFNEGVMCYPGCWNQVASLGADDRFKGSDVVAMSVVVDSKKEWDDAIQQMPELANATVVHDNGAKVSSAYGVLTTKSSMHYGRLPGHTYIVIDGNGIIRHVYDDPNMAIHNDALIEVLEGV